MIEDTNNTITEHISEEETRQEKCHALREKGINPFAYTFERTASTQDILSQYAALNNESEPVTESFQLAGRLMAKRGHGKAFFGNIQDESGPLQFYANINELGEDLFEFLTQLDTGDIIGITGSPFVTKRGELSLRITTIELLTKAVSPLPEKYHGLQDKERRYRQRYVDLIVNNDVKSTFQKRSQIIKNIRDFLHKDNFMEVETPVLHHIYGGAAAKPFDTHHNELKQNLYLRIALELHLKRLIVGGYERIFEIGRVFRNEGVSYKHNPEYTLLELYEAYADYHDMMNLTENLISNLVKSQTGTTTLTYQEKTIDFNPPFQRITLKEVIQKHANIDINDDRVVLAKKAESLGLEVNDKTSKGQLINYIYDKEVEHHLINPTFVMDYPWETSPLAKRKRDDDSLVERFELIINGMEIANAFSELNDPEDQEQRFLEQQKAKDAGDEEAHQMDKDFINALRYGMPPTGGLGIGIDRIVMLLTNQPSIRDVLFFPHLKQ